MSARPWGGPAGLRPVVGGASSVWASFLSTTCTAACLSELASDMALSLRSRPAVAASGSLGARGLAQGSPMGLRNGMWLRLPRRSWSPHDPRKGPRHRAGIPARERVCWAGRAGEAKVQDQAPWRPKTKKRRKAKQPRRIFARGRPWLAWFRCAFTRGGQSRFRRATSSGRSMPLAELRTTPPTRAACPAGRRISRRALSWLLTLSLTRILAPDGLPLWRSRLGPRWWGGLPRSSASSPAVSARMPPRSVRPRNGDVEISPNTRNCYYHWLGSARDSQTLRKQGFGPLKASSSASSALTGLTPKKANAQLALVWTVAAPRIMRFVVPCARICVAGIACAGFLIASAGCMARRFAIGRAWAGDRPRGILGHESEGQEAGAGRGLG